MKLFWKRMKKNNKGLSLVELVCAVAIFGVATTVIGGAMVVSAQSYSRGTYELDVQQEAQTTTNLIGNLLHDATDATYNSGTQLLVIEGKDIEYHIKYNASTKSLEYEQYVGGATLPATGTLAYNVTGFSTNLDGDADGDGFGDAFAADKNVEVTLEVEKNNRTYQAKYNTTSRNGVADSSGVSETAEIVIDDEVVLEPGQTYLLKYDVKGSILDKGVNLSSSSGISVTKVEKSDGTTYVSIYVDKTATGNKTFTISTKEMKKDALGAPTTEALSTVPVDVKIRRVNEITCSQDDNSHDGIADNDAVTSGTPYMKGAKYRFDFSYVAENPSKVYGADFDTNYVNPLQMTIDYEMTGCESGKSKNDYIEAVQISGGENPYISFVLKENMPNGSEITVVATALHPSGTNKTHSNYTDTPVVDVVKIKYSKTVYGSADFLRGSDGVCVINNDVMSEIDKLVANDQGTTQDQIQNRRKHLMTVYEVLPNGTLFACPQLVDFVVGSNMSLQVEDEHSKKLDPKKAYVYKLELMYYDASGNPLWTDSPYYSEYYPLDPISVIYTPQVERVVKNGTSGSYYDEVTAGKDCTIPMDILGLEMSSHQNEIKFVVEEYVTENGVSKWKGTTKCSNMMVASFTKNTGKIEYKFNFSTPGEYRVKAYVSGLQYQKYDAATGTYISDTANYDLYNDADDTGIFYILVK